MNGSRVKPPILESVDNQSTSWAAADPRSVSANDMRKGTQALDERTNAVMFIKHQKRCKEKAHSISYNDTNDKTVITANEAGEPNPRNQKKRPWQEV